MLDSVLANLVNETRPIAKRADPMDFILQPWQLALAILAGWVNRQQQELIVGSRQQPPAEEPRARTSSDGRFTVLRVECQGACANAPMMEIGGEYHEDLDEQRVADILAGLERGERAGGQVAGGAR